jgi:hypothetical protein
VAKSETASVYSFIWTLRSIGSIRLGASGSLCTELTWKNKVCKKNTEDKKNLVERKLFLAIGPSLLVFLTALGHPGLSLLLVFAGDFLELVESVWVVDYFVHNLVQEPETRIEKNCKQKMYLRCFSKEAEVAGSRKDFRGLKESLSSSS